MFQSSAGAPWRWPTPPFAGYVAPKDDAGAVCEIEGLTSAAVAAELLRLDFDRGSMRIRVAITGTAMTLRFAQLRRITLTAPLAVDAPNAGDPHARLLAHHPVVDHRLHLVGGGWLTGRSIGHVQSPHGLFLFPPADDRGSVRRMFVPASTYREFEIGPRVGQVLVEQSAVTSEQVDIAVAEQAALRARKLGDPLVTNRIVTPEELLAAIDQQARMPVVRSGEARVALGLTRLPIELDVARRLSHQSMNQYRVLLLLLRLPRGARLLVAVATLSNIPHLKSQCAMAGPAVVPALEPRGDLARPRCRTGPQ